jgi:hypothetical protein
VVSKEFALLGGGDIPSAVVAVLQSCTKSMFVVSYLVLDDDVPGRAKPVVNFSTEVAT